VTFPAPLKHRIAPNTSPNTLPKNTYYIDLTPRVPAVIQSFLFPCSNKTEDIK